MCPVVLCTEDVRTEMSIPYIDKISVREREMIQNSVCFT